MSKLRDPKQPRVANDDVARARRAASAEPPPGMRRVMVYDAAKSKALIDTLQKLTGDERKRWMLEIARGLRDGTMEISDEARRRFSEILGVTVEQARRAAAVPSAPRSATPTRLTNPFRSSQFDGAPTLRVGRDEASEAQTLKMSHSPEQTLPGEDD